MCLPDPPRRKTTTWSHHVVVCFCPLMAPQGMWNMRPATAAAVGACGAPGTDAQKYSEHWFRVPRMPPWRPQSPGAHAPHGMRRGGGWSPTQHPPRHAPHAMRSGPRKPAAAGPETGRSPQLLHFTRNPAVGGADPSQPRAAGRVLTAPAPLYNARPARPPRAPNEPDRRELREKGTIFVPSPRQTRPPLPKPRIAAHVALPGPMLRIMRSIGPCCSTWPRGGPHASGASCSR